MTKFGDKTVLHVHVQVTSSFSQPLYYPGDSTMHRIHVNMTKVYIDFVRGSEKSFSVVTG